MHLQRETSGPGDLQENDRTSSASLASEHTEAGDGPAGPGEPVKAGEAPEAGQATPEQIAEGVYELFRRDLRVYRERKGL